MNFKFYLFLLFFLLSITVKAQWTILPTGGTDPIRAVHFINDSLGYAGGDSITHSVLIKTTNGGSSWNSIAPNFRGAVTGIYFASANKGWVVTNNPANTLLQTVNGGTSWNVVQGISNRCGFIYFKNTNEGYLHRPCGGVSYYTNDGGSTWNLHLDTDLSAITTMHFSPSNSMVGYAMRSDSKLYKTTDGGTNWNYLRDITGHGVNKFYFTSDTVGYALSTISLIKTIDGGINWTPVNKNIGGNEINFISGEMYLDGNFRSTDTGATYQQLSQAAFNDISYPGGNYIYGAAQGGEIHKLDLALINNTVGTSKNSLFYAPSGGTRNVDLTAIGNWTVSVPSWIQVSPSSGNGDTTLAITCLANNENSDRPGTVTITNGSSTALIDIYQYYSNPDNDWVQLDVDVSESLYVIHFVDDSLGFAGGDGLLNPVLIKTTDGGSSWTRIDPPVDGPINGIQFTSPNDGWIVSSYQNYLLHTVNGGNTWNVFTLINDYCGTIYFKNTNEGYYNKGCGGYSLYTNNGGLSWNSNSDLLGITAMHFASGTSSTGYALRYGKDLYKTTDGGIHWNFVVQISSDYISSIQFITDSEGYATGSSTLKTIDGGNTWTVANALSGYEINVVPGKYFLGSTFMSTDSATTFQSLQGAEWTYDAYYPSANSGYTVGPFGKIYKLDLNHNSVINPGASKNMLFFTYPNPAHDEVNIVLDDKLGAGSVSIKDSQGRSIYYSDFISSKTIYISNFPPGLYFVVVIKDGKKASSKFVKE